LPEHRSRRQFSQFIFTPYFISAQMACSAREMIVRQGPLMFALAGPSAQRELGPYNQLQQGEAISWLSLPEVTDLTRT
jgi:hypothetical protein